MTNRNIISRRATAWVKQLSLYLLFGISFASMASPRNYLRNPDFSNNGKEWRITQFGDARKIKVSTQTIGKTYEVDIAGTTRGSSIRLQQDAIELPGNSEYLLRFTVDAEHDSSNNWFTIQDADGQFLYHNPHAVKKGKNDFRFRFFTPISAKDISANMLFQIGGMKGKNIFSGLSITAVNESDTIPYAIPERWNVTVGNENKQAAISGKLYNISAAFGPYRNIPAVFETTVGSDREGFMEAGFSADYYMEVYLNDKLEYSTRTQGNGSWLDYSPSDHPLYLYLQKGENKLRVKVWPGTGGWRFVCGKPEQLKVFRPGKDYRPISLTDLHIKVGSALDLSTMNKGPCGSLGRVVINKNGDFAVESQPDIPLKLFGFNSWNDFNFQEADDKTFQAEIRRTVAAARRMGYNYTRVWLNEYVSCNNNAPFGVTPKSLERFDFFLHELEQNGIYVNLLITGPNLFGDAAEFGANRARIHVNRMLMYLHDERVEKNWLYGLSLLNYVGPWSKKAIKDNPCIAEVECFNEQYAGLALLKQIRQTHPADYAKFQTAWNRFLSEKYARTFTSEPVPENGAPYFNDFTLFCEKLVCDLNKWYVTQLRKCGYTGAIVQNDYKNLLFRSAAWQTMLALDDHTYYAYASKEINVNSRLDRDSESSLKNGVSYIRELTSGRFDGRPFLAGEYNHGFWNRYQYECGAAWGAYAALQGFSGFNIHDRPLVRDQNDLRGWKRLGSFTVGINPVARGGEFLNAHLFLRGDVKPSQHLVTLLYPNKFLYSDGNAYKAPSTAQSMLALVSRYSLAFPELPVPPGVSRGRKPDLALRPSGLADIIDHEWFTIVAETKDKDFSLSGAITALRKKGILGPENLTDVERGIYQSDTGEITMRTNARQLIVNTPHTEVFVSPAGNREKINVLEVLNSTANACVGIVSRDGAPLDKSKHIVLVYTTRVANTEMRLSPNEKVMVAPGYLPVLLQSGQLVAALRNASDRLDMYALALNGERREKIPLEKRNGKWEIKIDTSKLKKEPAVFFEITAE